MSDTYVECLISRKPNTMMNVLKIFLIVLASAAVLLGFMGLPFGILAGLVLGLLAWVCSLFVYTEYEYLYLDKEISVDRIRNQSKRKRVAAFEVDRIEIIAPLKSHELDSYNRRTVKELDYSDGYEKQPEERYCMFYNGEQKVIFSPSEELLKAVKTVAPRKVFFD